MQLILDPLNPIPPDPFCHCGGGAGGDGSGGPGDSSVGVDVEGIGAVGAGNQGQATAANDAAAAANAANANTGPDISSIDFSDFNVAPDPSQSLTAPGNTISGGPATGAGIGVVDALGNVHGFTGSPAVNDSSVAEAIGEAVAANPAGFAATSPQATGLAFDPISTAINAMLSQTTPAFSAVNLGLALGNALGVSPVSSIGQAVVDAVGFGTNSEAAEGGSAGPGGVGGGPEPAFPLQTTAQAQATNQPPAQTVASQPTPKPGQVWNPYTGDPLRYGFGPEHGFKTPNILDPAFYT